MQRLTFGPHQYIFFTFLCTFSGYLEHRIIVSSLRNKAYKQRTFASGGNCANRTNGQADYPASHL